MPKSPGFFHRPFFIRLFNWEFWSFNALYGWIMPVWFLLCLRARSFFFFNASNPRIENGGLTNENKKDIHAILPEDLYPRTRHFAKGTVPTDVLEGLREKGLALPLIGKPDIGGRGRGIKILKTEEDIIHYAQLCTMDYHIQDLVPWPLEVGIFYCRMPDEEKGRITGIVRKEFLSVTGDGRSTLRELVRYDKRAIMYMKSIEEMHGPVLDKVPAAGERIVLSHIGNHARGALFLDETSLADARLNETIDKVSKRIPEFYFGRLDIRYRDWEALKRGEDFVMLEVNGAGAEPTHMYDPKHSLFWAWREIIRHWVWLFRISRANHKKGIPYLTFAEGMAMVRKDKEIDLQLKEIPL